MKRSKVKKRNSRQRMRSKMKMDGMKRKKTREDPREGGTGGRRIIRITSV